MRSLIVVTLALVSSLVAVPALAAPVAGGDAPAHVAHGKNGEGKHGKKFPMAAAEFKTKADERLAKARAHMEQRAAKLPADKAKELRTGFEAGAAKVNAEVAKATADGTVTKDEAGQVRTAMREVRGHKHGGKARRGESKKK